jgi:hypothetical protein
MWRRGERAREPSAAPLLREVDDQVVAAGLEVFEELLLGGEAIPSSVGLPFPPHHVKTRQRRMAFEHRRGVVVDQRVDLHRGRVRAQRADHGRREQHVAVMAELDDQRALAFPQRDGVPHHPARVPQSSR